MKKLIAVLLALFMLLSLAACGGESSGLAGRYPVSSAVMDGEEWDLDEMESFGMAEGVYLQLNEDGTGELSFGPQDAGSITYDEKKGTLAYGDGTTFPFTVEGDTITVVFEDDDGMAMRYTRDSAEAPASGGVSGSSGAGSFDFGDVRVAVSITDAFSGYAASGFVSDTTSLEMGSLWYGILECTDFVGTDTEDYTKDIVGTISETSQGYDYFEAYAGNEIDSDNLILSFYIQLYEDSFDADIGYQDAWVFDRYLEEGEEHFFSPSLVNGALEMWYDFEDPNGEFSCKMHFFLREDGAAWDEENDPLPPGYAEYKAALNG